MIRENKGAISITLSQSIIEWLNVNSTKNKMTRSAYIETLIQNSMYSEGGGRGTEVVLGEVLAELMVHVVHLESEIERINKLGLESDSERDERLRKEYK